MIILSPWSPHSKNHNKNAPEHIHPIHRQNANEGSSSASPERRGSFKNVPGGGIKENFIRPQGDIHTERLMLWNKSGSESLIQFNRFK